MDISRREPVVIAAGDTLQWIRTLRLYSSGAGYFLDYEIRGGAAPISFQSTADADGLSHDISVAAAVTANWLPGNDMEMEGYAVNNTLNPPTRNRIYFGNLNIVANLQGAPGDVPVKTFAQRMVEKCERAIEEMTVELLSSRVGDTEFHRQKLADIRQEHGYWVCLRRNEIQLDRARNGQDSGQRIRPLAKISTPGPVVGETIFVGALG